MYLVLEEEGYNPVGDRLPGNPNFARLLQLPSEFTDMLPLY